MFDVGKLNEIVVFIYSQTPFSRTLRGRVVASR